MFEDLIKYEDMEFWKENPIIRFTTESTDEKYMIFLVNRLNNRLKTSFPSIPGSLYTTCRRYSFGVIPITFLNILLKWCGYLKPNS